ncbi:hypothetical protein FKP32DRAFT_1610135 [Trametes sanguinea]|nr:hypothetical protein FKP32DRAFT_1610135 [Trametes sanguinea]
MFYSRPTVVPHTSKMDRANERYLSQDILNRIHPCWLAKPRAGEGPGVDPDPHVQMEHARHLAKYVYPRQYGLSSPFDSATSSPWIGSRSPDFLDREQEIKSKGPCMTPKRVKGVLSTLEKLIWRHRKCRYKSLLDLTCPSKVQ